ncbi:ROK family transcriptional regulator [Breznakiella homolactica]|uniref:ROK family transcriptional regulator n=1 Tax=Breznakiella homolactica TaxID=2798577 RepID=A0A7T7XPP0_9SPIR|nr:ROK family transcriptional regulator [Breznakiella homolactica]QQO10167.1 ROK family transcriptional regulator [Breznakiella homolactica]
MINKQEKNSDLAVFSLLSLIKEHGSISQVRLSELSGYSRSTVSINCDKLLSAGYIISDSSSTTNKRKNIEFRLNKNLGYVVGLGLGGSSCRIALFDIEGTMIESNRIPVDLMCGPEPVLEGICADIDAMLRKHKKKNTPLLGIGMGLPSPVQYEEGVAFHPAFMPGWHLFPVKKFLSDRYGCHVFIDNEVNTLALGEFAELKDRKLKTLLCVKVGTGIGAGIIIDGNIYRGEKGGGGNIGHIHVDHDNTPCSCGKTGCIEAIASLPAVERRAEQLAERHPESLLAEVLRKQKKITITDIRQAADKGDRLSLRLIRDAGTTLGNLLGKLIIFIDPAMLIIAGRLTVLGPTYLDYVRKATLNEAAPWVGAAFAIEFSKLKEDSSASGAALLCISELFGRQLITKIAGRPVGA